MNSLQSETLLQDHSDRARRAARQAAQGAPFRLPEPSVAGRQITELGHSIAELGNEYPMRAASSAPQEPTVLAAAAFANAVGSAAQAASALGAAAHTADKRGKPGFESARGQG